MDIKEVGKLQFNEYQKMVMRTAGDDLEIVNSVLGLNGEAGEVADHFKKHLYQGHKLDTKEVALELGDCLWYLTVLAKIIGYDLECIAKMNNQKLLKRYPDGFNAERSVNREQ